MNLGLFSLILVLLQYVVHSQYRVSVLGWINVAISVGVFAAPLSIVVSCLIFIICKCVIMFSYQIFNICYYMYV